MRKLGRIVRRVLTAVSLLLFVAVLAAWVRGYFRLDYFGRKFNRFEQSDLVLTDWFLESGRGDVEIRHSVISISTVDGMWRGIDMPSWVGWRYGSGDANQVWGRTVDLARKDLKSSFEADSRMWEWAGVRVMKLFRRSKYGERVEYVAIVPCWMAAIVFGMLPSWRAFVWWRGVRRRRLASLAGRCGVCGYDLRASPGRCPECGTAVGGKEQHGDA